MSQKPRQRAMSLLFRLSVAVCLLLPMAGVSLAEGPITDGITIPEADIPNVGTEQLPDRGSSADVADAEAAAADNPLRFGLTQAEIEKIYAPLGDEPVIVIVQLAEPDVVNYQGGIGGMGATAPTSGQPFNANTPAAQAYISYLNGRHAQFVAEANQVSPAAKPVATYVAALNGVALTVPAADVIKISQLPGVKAVMQNGVAQLDTDRGPTWIGAPSVWADLGGQSLAGEDVVIGVIDGGAWSPNPITMTLPYTDPLPSYADDASVVGGAYAFPFTSVTGISYTDHLGVCDSVSPQASDLTFVCNNKLIGGWWYNAGNIAFAGEVDSPLDMGGHGTHTSSTAGGNVVTPTVGAGPIEISGVAPRARLVMYKACWEEDPADTEDGGCAFVDTTSAVNQAILDGVNVLNYSIGGPATVGGNSTELAFLSARAAGIFVSTSAGNSGPGASTVAHVSPWVNTSAAMEHDRDFRGTLTLTSTYVISMPTDLEGATMTGGHSAEIILAPLQTGESVLPSLCNEPYAPGTFQNDEIVVCRRGIDARVEKGYNVLQGGAGGYVLVNAAANQGLALDAHWLPALHLEFNATAFSDPGEDLVTYLQAAANASAVVTGTLSGGAAIGKQGDVMAAFSSRGPAINGLNLIKPDNAAPGVAILAGVSPYVWDTAFVDGTYYQFYNGTSMSSPHTAGAGALLKALHPYWTAAEIQSALMTGAVEILKEDGTTPADPFDQGSGRLDLSQSRTPGLLFDIPIVDYQMVMSGTKDIETLNYPSMANTACLNTCSWTRTAQDASGAGGTYTWTVVSATPNLTVTLNAITYTVAASGTVPITITADVSALPSDGNFSFARVILHETTTGDEVALPVAVVATSGTLPKSIAFEVQRNAGSYPIEDVTAIEITDLTITPYGLVQANLNTQSPAEDTTRGDPYDNLNQGVFWITVTVPAGAKRLVAEITESTSDDIDMFVGIDSDANGPEAGEEVDASATGAVLEYVSIDNPAPGTYWVLVQNFEDGLANDPTTLATGVVPNSDGGNMDVTGPVTVTQLSPFDLRFFWDTPTMQVGDRWYGAFGVGSDSGNPGNIGTTAVDIVRIEDDVIKTANVATAHVGDTVTYTITINPNVLPEDLTYTLTDTIPAGMTYVSGTVTGGASVVGDTLTWSGVMDAAGSFTYIMTSSDDDPSCEMPLTTHDAYLDAQTAFGFNPLSAVTGDSITYNMSAAGDPYEFWGVSTQNFLSFSDDGFIRIGSTSAPAPWINRPIPYTGTPNSLIAMMWRDMEFIYATAPVSRGVTLVTFGTSAAGGTLIEYDDMQLWQDPSVTLDVEMFMWRSAGVGPEIIFAYNNISGTLDVGTVGVENATGTVGVQYAYDDAALANINDGDAICFDWGVPEQNPHVITYAVTVDPGTAGDTLTNDVIHTVDNPGSAQAGTSTDVLVLLRDLYLPIVFKP